MISHVKTLLNFLLIGLSRFLWRQVCAFRQLDDLLTSNTVMSVFSSMRYCLGDRSDYSAIWAALAFMPFGLFFDFMDGRIARWRRKSSLMGQELDSLADLVCGHPIGWHGFTANVLACSFRSPSVSPPPLRHSHSEYGHLSTTSSWPSSFFAG